MRSGERSRAPDGDRALTAFRHGRPPQNIFIPHHASTRRGSGDAFDDPIVIRTSSVVPIRLCEPKSGDDEQETQTARDPHSSL